jgi:hypothetical protein
MAKALVQSIIEASASPVGDADGGAGFNSPIALSYADGVGSFELDRVLRDVRSIAASGSETISLRGLTDNGGNSTSAATDIRFLRVSIKSRTAAGAVNASSLTFKCAASNGNTSIINGSTDAIIVPKGGYFAFAAPLDGSAPVSGTLRDITIANPDSANALEYELVVGLVNS